MRRLYLAIVVLFVAAILIFLLQNTQSVDVSFLSLAVSVPLALVVFVAYAFGAMTGGSLYGLLRRSFQRSRRAA